MLKNNIDNVFKQKIGEITEMPAINSWDKENSWFRLKKKRRQKILKKVYYYVAAILILGFTINQIANSNLFNHNSNQFVENPELEFQKRQKLAEIEAKMSGNYYSVKLCSVCDEIYFQSVKVDRPVQFLYFETN
jgi:hypothetical protein